MAVAVAGSPFELALLFRYIDARGQKASKRQLIDPAALDADIATFVGHVDAATNGQITVEKEAVYAITGTKGAAVVALEQNISEVMEILLDAVDPISPSHRHVTGKFPIYAMSHSIENFPSGSLNTGNSDIAGIITFLNASALWVDATGTAHVGLLQVVPGDSNHITEADVVDQV